MTESANTPAASASPATPTTPAGNPQRKKALITIASVVVLAGLGWAAYDAIVASHYENTDNAYVQGNIIQITPQVSGNVMTIMADDTDFVKAGQPLVQFDPADAKLALDQAEANLAQTVRQVRTLYANNSALSAQVAQRTADVARTQTDIARAQSEVERAADDLRRRQTLTGNGAVSKEELSHAQTQLANAKAGLSTVQASVSAAQAGVSAAQEQLASNQAMTEGTSVEQHPNVLAAAARVREAYLASQRAAVVAPVDGYVAKRTVQLGQRIAAGTSMMSIIPLNQVWVDANFKEVQLRNIRIGQPVKLTADLYGKKMEYTGKVEGLGVGTGAAFALLPAQNATGNWIKVVQRVPVRIALDAKQLVDNPLRVGLSMDATIDVTKQDGKMLADAPRSASLATLTAPTDKGGDLEVQRVIAANLGGRAVLARNDAAKASKAVEAPAALAAVSIPASVQ